MFIQRANNNFDIQLADIPVSPFANTKSLSFDGVDDYVTCGDSNDFSFGDGTTDSPFSISAWVKMDGIGTFGIFNKYGGGTSNSEYIFGFQYGNRLQLVLTNNNSLYLYRGRSYIQTLNTGQWYHVLGTYDGRGGNLAQEGIRLYVDGIRVDDTDNSYLAGYTAMGNTSTPVLIGKQLSTYSDGLIDEVSIFNRVVTPAEIVTLSTAPTVDLTSLNPISWYRNGDNGAYKSPQWLIPSNENKDKVSNYSMDFDGVDSKIDVANNTTIGRTQNISYSIWVNLVSTTARQYIVGNGRSSNFGTRLSIETTGGNALLFQIGDSTNDSFFGSRVSNFGTLATPGTWNHILATWDGIDAKIYINGNLENTWSPTLPYTIDGWDPFRIGYRVDGLTGEAYKTNGKLDEISLFDTAISIGDVWDGSGQPIDVSGVSGITNYWKMGENATFTYDAIPDGTWAVPDEVGTSNATSNNLMADSARVGEAPGSSNNAVSFNMDFVDVVTDVP